MKNWALRWVTSAIALAIIAHLNIHVWIDPKSYYITLIEATIFIGLANSLIRPILALMTMPLNCITFGLFGFVLNAILFGATQLFVPGFKATFTGAFIGSILMGLISGGLNYLLPDDKK